MSLDPIGIGSVAEAAKDILGMFFPDKTEEEKAKIAAAMALVQGQLDANRVEAANQNIFVAGWRPFIGWVCGSGFAIQFVIGPLCQWVSGLIGHPIVFPPLDLGTMLPLLLGMLGLGGMRTVEKLNGTVAGH